MKTKIIKDTPNGKKPSHEKYSYSPAMPPMEQTIVLDGTGTIIDNDTDERGLYNLASFNKTAEQIAYEVGNTMNVPVIEYETDPTNITNTKIQTKTYNFSISTLKFRKTFKFKFKETVESITQGLIDNWDSMKKTDRSQPYEYK